jgi:hypothetical protein
LPVQDRLNDFLRAQRQPQQGATIPEGDLSLIGAETVKNIS